jgi:hypothetical protein
MIDHKLKVIAFLLSVFFLGVINVITAQESADHLVISQVSVNNDQPGKSWLEIYNPTDNALVLERFRLSHLRSINVLPQEIRNEGGIKVGAGKYIVLCADENLFKSSFGDEVKAIYVKALSRVTSGGFLAITTTGAGGAKGIVVRYGKRESSSNIAELAGDQVIGFSEEGKSYTRKIERSGTGIIISDFIESYAHPGKSNN